MAIDGRQHGNRRDKPVALAGKRLYIEGIFAGIAQRFAQFHHCGVQRVVEVDESICRPKLDSQVFPGDDLPCVLQKKKQELGRLLLQPDGNAIPSQFGCPALQFKGSEGPVPRTVWFPGHGNGSRTKECSPALHRRGRKLSQRAVDRRRVRRCLSATCVSIESG